MPAVRCRTARPFIPLIHPNPPACPHHITLPTTSMNQQAGLLLHLHLLHVSSCPDPQLTHSSALALPCNLQFRASSTSDKRQECSDKTELDYLHHSPALVTQTYVCALSTSSLPISRIHASTSTFRQRGLAPLLSHQEREPEQSRALPLLGSTTDHRPKPNPSHDGIITTAHPSVDTSRAPAFQPGFLNPLP